MSSKFIGIILGLPILFLGMWGVSLKIQMNSGLEVRLPIRGYDPRDLLSGHYIQYQIDWENADCRQFENGICPKDEFCVKSLWGGKQCRFYIPEEHARALDNLFRVRNTDGVVVDVRNTDDMVFEVMYSYKKGFKPMAKELLINGKDWREAI